MGSSLLNVASGPSGRLVVPMAVSPSHSIRRVLAAAAANPGGGRRRGDGGRSRQSDPNPGTPSKRGKNAKKSIRKGRPEWMRKPDDSPLRDGNRDRVIGLVTLRAARTLAYYLSETSPVVYNWLNLYIHQHPIPRDGAWDDVSGDTFLRELLKTPPELAAGNFGRNSMFSSGRGMPVDPRQIAQRIMEIRVQLSKEMTQDLETMTEENNALMRETLLNSFAMSLENVVEHPVDQPVVAQAVVVPVPETSTSIPTVATATTAEIEEVKAESAQEAEPETEENQPESSEEPDEKKE